MSDYIPEDILIQVLKHLPVESLVRSRCVCRRWKRLIDSPYFVLEHIAVQKPRLLILNVSLDEPEFLLLDPQTIPFVDTMPYPGEKLVFIHTGTLHGVVCFYEYSHIIGGLYLWNPSMRKLLNVPVPAYMHYDRCSRTGSAFWIDPFTKHFKMIMFNIDGKFDKYKKRGAIYSSVEGDWKEVSPGELRSKADYFLYNFDPGLVIGEVAYWVVWYEYDCSKCRYKCAIISYHFEQESFDSIEELRTTYGSLYGYPSLCNREGRLSLVHLDTENRCHFYSRQEGSWYSLFSISLSSNIYQVFCLVDEVEENGKILLVENTDCELVLFDTRVGFVALQSGHTNYSEGGMAHEFVESLVFP